MKNSRREQLWLESELENRDRAHQETRSGTLQEVAELKRICCTETERIQELRTDDLSRQELRKSQSTVNQSMTQTQELQTLWMTQEILKILRQQAVLDHSTFPVIL